MKLYLASVGAGLLVGVIYGVMQVRSPAPPVVALLGLLGILVGEQVVPVARRILDGCGLNDVIAEAECRDHVLGTLPANAGARAAPPRSG